MSDNPGSTDQGGQAGAGAGTPAGSWHDGIPDADLRGYVQTKGFKDPASLAESYRNLEKLQGVPQDRLLKLPEKSDDPAWEQIHARLGRPEKPEGYEFKVEGDEAFAKRMSEAMFKAGVPKSAAKALEGEWNGYVADLIKQDEEARKQADQVEMNALRTKWGGDFDANSEMARRAGREFGLGEAEFKAIESAMGAGKFLELFQRIGAKLGEPKSFDGGAGGGGNTFGMTREAAQSRIRALSADSEWTAKYLSGNVEAKDEMTRLQKIAAGEA